jgi:hypothetical protein
MQHHGLGVHAGSVGNEIKPVKTWTTNATRYGRYFY